jgi:hypothetical protein
MPRFSLRTLIVVMLLAGPILAGAWFTWEMLYPRSLFEIEIGGPSPTWFQKLPDGSWKAYRIDGDSVHEIAGTFTESPEARFLILPGSPEAAAVARFQQSQSSPSPMADLP